MIVVRMITLTITLLYSAQAFTQTDAPNECVILLHGLARTSQSMVKLETKLVQSGYLVANISYPSRDHTIETLAPMAISQGLNLCQDQSVIHFVTHSLGGILVRHYLEEHKLSKLGRVVMLGPPNQGSEVVDKLKHVPGFKFINGPAGFQLGTGDQSMPAKLGPAKMDVGIIAGNRSINLILSLLIPGPDDGKVSITRTKLDGASDYKLLPVAHPFLPLNDQVIDHALYFLKHGQFPAEQE